MRLGGCASSLRLSHRPPFDPLFVVGSLEDALHVDAWRVNLVRIELARLDQKLDFGNRDPAGGRHHGIEVPRRLAINEIAPAIALPRFNEREVGGHTALKNIRPAAELACLLALGYNCSEPGRRVEAGNARAAGPDTLGQRALRNEFEINAASEHHVFEQLILADVAALV